ncbi:MULTISPECIES: hypothetical protein [Streptomyces]|uniref:Uncharacterized protein n=2 Tax=Streptomyces TaxID=1883 RepID=A0A3R7FHN4_9ACTN|nr:MULTISPECIES: hypothetical protein [Streptomyces]KNE79225.1 hypothetical protein ADZ36_28805 [Streptomyces fradiae]OFA62013.1 hypothetical protein BEN35_00915 [Streptomyces fradiae]PQM24338.1 hypothetical protein Sfr7A_06065 [Streptomyces xinghaiensis]RKM97306.1 hypothetical protein SFRA_008755 [Streptomyces xinghaiensis]RNC75299.1 hypothetical protein DC095_005845 [Streptomyces xinghaiensis]
MRRSSTATHITTGGASGRVPRIRHGEGRALLPPASGGGESADPPVAHVFDVPAEPGPAASVATSSEMRRVFGWQVGDGPPVTA